MSRVSDFADDRGYERFMGRWSRLLGREFVTFAGVADGERVLDVGCGTGSLAGVLLSTPIAGVVGVDPSAAFVAAARRRVSDPRARFAVGDAQRLAFPDGAFDRTMSMLVLNFVPDSAAAAAEMRRVTRPGGVAAACVWDYGGEMHMLRRFWEAANVVDPTAASRHEARMHLAGAGELATLWRQAGFEDVLEAGLTIPLRFASFADYWEPFLAGVGPSGAYAASLGDEARAALEARLRADLWSDRPEEPRELPARAWAVVGRSPGAGLRTR